MLRVPRRNVADPHRRVVHAGGHREQCDDQGPFEGQGRGKPSFVPPRQAGVESPPSTLPRSALGQFR